MINSGLLIKILLVVYVCISFVCLYENNYPQALYWTSAGLISLSVLWGMGK